VHELQKDEKRDTLEYHKVRNFCRV